MSWLFAVSLVTAVVWVAISTIRSRSTLERVGHRLGLQFDSIRGELTGRVDGLRVSIGVDSGEGKSCHVITMKAAVASWARFTAAGPGNLQTGDPLFDRAVRVDVAEGSTSLADDRARRRAEVFAVLDTWTRENLRAAVERGCSIEDGQLVWRSEHLGPEELEARTRRAVALVDRMAIPAQKTGERLMLIVKRDLSPHVQREALKVLLSSPYARDVPEAAEVAAKNEDAALRLMGALALGEDGLSALSAIVADDMASGRVRQAALEAIGALRSDEAKRVSEKWWSYPDILALVKAQGALSQQAVEELGFRHESRAEKALVWRLDTADEDLKLAIVRALGMLASRAAIAPLRELTKGLFANAALKQAAQTAIDRIERRSPGEPGALSLTDPQGGELSVSAEAGALALSEADE
jgi:hypothetical protein